MPDSFSLDSAVTTATEAQSSLLRISRRHSLPASTTFSNIFSLWGNENDPAAPPGCDHYNHNHSDHQNSNHLQQQQRPSSNGAVPCIVNGNGSRVGGNRHRYGHRHTRSAVVDQPVIVKSYNPGPASSSIASPIHEEDDLEKLVLPSIDSFSFDGILKSIEPEVTSALTAVSHLCTEYQSSLQTEVDGLVEAQSQIDARMKEADKLTAQALRTTKTRTERIDSESSALKGGSAADTLAQAAEATHTTLTSIITTLLAIDEMLPAQERLSPLTSAHKRHYPKLHGLLAEKAHELNVLFRSGRSAEPTSSPLPRAETGETSSSRDQQQESSVWARRRMPSMSTSEITTGPSLTRSNTFSHPNGLPSPHIQLRSPHLHLRTLLPSPSSPNPESASGGAYYPIPPRTATSICLTNTNSIAPISPTAPRRHSGFWPNRRSSSSALAFFPEGTKTNTNTTAGSKGWRYSGSWEGLFGGGGGGKRGSLLSVDNGNEPEGAQERLRRVLEGGNNARRGKGKGVVS